MPVGPRAVYVYWDIADGGAESWEVSARRDDDDAVLHRFTVPGSGSDGWAQVPPDTRGRLTLHCLLRGELLHVATLSFATPPVLVAGANASSWLRLAGDHGFVEADRPQGSQAPIQGRALGASSEHRRRR